jgi:hypothetical protein
MRDLLRQHNNSACRRTTKARPKECQLGDDARKALEMVPWTGVEPVTLRLGGGCSIQLSYQGRVAILTE